MVLISDGNSEHEGKIGLFGEEKNRFVTAPEVVNQVKEIAPYVRTYF